MLNWTESTMKALCNLVLYIYFKDFKNKPGKFSLIELVFLLYIFTHISEYSITHKIFFVYVWLLSLNKYAVDLVLYRL